MFEYLKTRIIGEGREKSAKYGKEGRENNEKKKNPINELQILEGHSDIVRLLMKVDEMR